MLNFMRCVMYAMVLFFPALTMAANDGDWEATYVLGNGASIIHTPKMIIISFNCGYRFQVGEEAFFSKNETVRGMHPKENCHLSVDMSQAEFHHEVEKIGPILAVI